MSKTFKPMTSVSKNAYIEKLDDMANKYKNTFQSKTKMKPVDVNRAHILTLTKRIIRNILNIKLMIM